MRKLFTVAELAELLGDEYHPIDEARQRIIDREQLEERLDIRRHQLENWRKALTGIGYQTIIEDDTVCVCVDENSIFHAKGLRLLFPCNQVTVLDEWNIEIK